MPFAAYPSYLLGGILLTALSPCLVLAGLSLYRGLRRSGPDADARVIAKLRQLEGEKHELVLRYEELQTQMVQTVDRVRQLERLLIDERRQRLAEAEEILTLRETCAGLRAKLEKAAHAIRATQSALDRRGTEKQTRAKKNPPRLSPEAGNF